MFQYAEKAITPADITGTDLNTIKTQISRDTGTGSTGTTSLANTDKFVIRAPSNKWGSCSLQPPTASFSPVSYAVSSTAADVELPAINQCQGLEITSSFKLNEDDSVPSWMEGSGGVLKVKPSKVTESKFLKGNSVGVTYSAVGAGSSSYSATVSVTFTNDAPTKSETPILKKTMYKGMKAHKITLPDNIFTDTDNLKISISSDLGSVTPKQFTITGNILEIELPPTYEGTFQATLTATDYVGQSVTTSFSILVEE